MRCRLSASQGDTFGSSQSIKLGSNQTIFIDWWRKQINHIAVSNRYYRFFMILMGSRSTSVLFALAFRHLTMVGRKRKYRRKHQKWIKYYTDTNAVKLIATFCSALLVWASSNKWTSRAVAQWNWRQKKARQRRAMLFSLIYFFAPFFIFYIPHNYIIPQAMPHVTLAESYVLIWKKKKLGNVTTPRTARWQIAV